VKTPLVQFGQALLHDLDITCNYPPGLITAWPQVVNNGLNPGTVQWHQDLRTGMQCGCQRISTNLNSYKTPSANATLSSSGRAFPWCCDCDHVDDYDHGYDYDYAYGYYRHHHFYSQGKV
jgi:hypothetical protein